MAEPEKVSGWIWTLLISCFVVFLIILDSSDGTKTTVRNLASGQSPAIQQTPLGRFKNSVPKDNPPDVRRIVIKLKPGVWSEYLNTPIGCDWRFDAQTPTGEIKVQFENGDIYKMKVDDYHHFGRRSDDPRFRSEKGGKVLITIKGGWSFSDFFK